MFLDQTLGGGDYLLFKKGKKKEKEAELLKQWRLEQTNRNRLAWVGPYRPFS